MRYKLILWDFDGTLADTLATAAKIYNELACKHGALPVGDLVSARDMATGEFLRAHNIPLYRVPLLVREFLAAQSERIDQARVFPQLVPVLARLSEMGVRMGVVSTNSQANIEACLRVNSAGQFFESTDGYSYLFGKHRAIRRALGRAGVAADATLYVGDEVRDIVAAGRAGVDVAAVTWGFNSERILREHEPTYIVESAAQLEAIVR